MPTYEFECEAHHEFTRELKIADLVDELACSCGRAARRVEIPSAQVTSADGRWHIGVTDASGRPIKESLRTVKGAGRL